MTPRIDALIQKHPALALALAPCAGAALVLALPFIGWIVLLRAAYEVVKTQLSGSRATSTP